MSTRIEAQTNRKVLGLNYSLAAAQVEASTDEEKMIDLLRGIHVMYQELDDHDRARVLPSLREVAHLAFADTVDYSLNPVLKVSVANQNSVDFPTFRQAMSGPEKAFWREACEVEMANLERHGVYKPVAEDSLPSWDAKRQKSSELVDMMWVLKKKYNEMRELLKYKARGTVRGDQESAVDQRLGLPPEQTFAPTVRHNTLKLRLAAAVVQSAQNISSRPRRLSRATEPRRNRIHHRCVADHSMWTQPSCKASR